MKRELLEGEYICPKCDGTGSDERAIWICDKCDGEGIVDWISKVTTKSLSKRMSALRLVNIKRSLIHIQKMAELLFPNFDLAHVEIKEYLELLKVNFAIYDYTTVHDESNCFAIDVFIQPTRTVEQVRLTLRMDVDAGGI